MQLALEIYTYAFATMFSLFALCDLLTGGTRQANKDSK